MCVCLCVEIHFVLYIGDVKTSVIGSDRVTSFPEPPMSEIPTTEEITAISALPVWDAQGNEHKFGSFFEEKKVIAVFIRKFVFLSYP